MVDCFGEPITKGFNKLKAVTNETCVLRGVLGRGGEQHQAARGISFGNSPCVGQQLCIAANMEFVAHIAPSRWPCCCSSGVLPSEDV